MSTDCKLAVLCEWEGEKFLEETSPDQELFMNKIELQITSETLWISFIRRRNQGDYWNHLTNLLPILSMFPSDNYSWLIPPIVWPTCAIMWWSQSSVCAGACWGSALAPLLSVACKAWPSMHSACEVTLCRGCHFVEQNGTLLWHDLICTVHARSCCERIPSLLLENWQLLL